MNVTIERDTCISCETCGNEYTESFEESPDDSFNQIIEEFRLNADITRGSVPEELKDCVRDAADLCPVQIIGLEE